MKTSTTIPSKLFTWIAMLLIWNIVLVGITIYYLTQTVSPLTAQEISNACTQAFLPNL
jgi:hypothetical protein